MIWFLKREGEHACYEIRRSSDSGEGYELLMTHADGSQRLERFADADHLVRGALDFQLQLVEAGWRSPGPAVQRQRSQR